MSYSTGFRNSIIKQILPPSNESMISVSKATGVNNRTISRWLQQFKDGTLDSRSKEMSSAHRNSLEKLNLLLKSRSLSEEDLGIWLRENGVHSETLKLWEQEIREIMTDKEKQYKEELRKIKLKNKQLEKELFRKEKALAELAALLTLKKKADAIWGAREDE